MKYIRENKKKSIVLGIILVAIIGMAWTGTLTYPYIMADRQIELIKYCSRGIDTIESKDFGFTINAPDGYCVLPHRIFPKDGSIHIIPKGNYSVINEYAKGTITQASMATILFEKTKTGRSPEELIENMRLGGFLEGAEVSKYTTKNGLDVVLAKNTIGLDPTARYDWAFILHPDGKVLISVLGAHPESPEVFNYVIDNLDITAKN
ncbi:MAG: hypothetical protein RL641_352 [Candidatus Parcubacteria bacterium]